VCGGTADAEDAAQEGFIKAYHALDRHREGAPFRPWLLRIVANEARNRRRSAGRRARYELVLVEDRALGEAVPSPESAVLTRETRQTLLVALAQLSEAQRDVIACRYMLGLSEGETAEVLAIPNGTVKSRLSRALDRLKELLNAE
jgi:RNA polymerase sigma-70 factor (ECF subfamily)